MGDIKDPHKSSAELNPATEQVDDRTPGAHKSVTTLNHPSWPTGIGSGSRMATDSGNALGSRKPLSQMPTHLRERPPARTHSYEQVSYEAPSARTTRSRRIFVDLVEDTVLVPLTFPLRGTGQIRSATPSSMARNWRLLLVAGGGRSWRNSNCRQMCTFTPALPYNQMVWLST